MNSRRPALLVRHFARVAGACAVLALVAGSVSADPPRGNGYDKDKGKLEKPHKPAKSAKPAKPDKPAKAGHAGGHGAEDAARGLDRAAERASEQGLKHGKAHRRHAGSEDAHDHDHDDHRDGQPDDARGERAPAPPREPEVHQRPETVGIPAPGRQPEVHERGEAQPAERQRGILSRFFGFMGFGADQ